MEFKGKVLIIEDTSVGNKKLNTILKENGYKVYAYNTGASAIYSVEAISPEIILIDLELKDMNGFQVCEKLKSISLVKEIPVIFLSRLINKEDTAKGFKLGAVDFIYRPFHESELIARVGYHIRMRQMKIQYEEQTDELLKKNIELKNSEEKYRNIVDSSPLGVYIYKLESDKRLIFMGANPAADKIIGTDHRKYIGKTIQEAFPNLAETDLPEIYSNIAVGNSSNYHFEVEYHDDQNINGFYNVTAFRSGENFITVQFDDISDRKKIEFELKRAQQITHIGSWYLDLSTNMVTWSEELYKMYGFDPTLPPPPYTEHMKLFTPESWELLSNSLAKTTETGEPYELELKTVRKDGSNGWMWVRGEVVKNSSGASIGLWGAAQDISERKNIELQLIESEMRSRSTFDQSPVGSAIIGLDKRFIKCNEAFCNFLGYTDDELQGKTISDITYPEDVELGMQDIKQMIEGKKEPATLQKRYVRKNGTITWGEVTISLGRDRDNKPICFLPIIQDINERKLAESRLELFFSQSIVGFFFMMLDEPINWSEDSDKEQLLNYAFSNQRITKINDAMLNQFGFTREQYIGLTPNDLFKNDIQKRKEEWKILFDTGKLHSIREEKKSNEESLILEVDYQCIYNSNGSIIGHFGIHRDITEQRNMVYLIQKERKLLRTLIDNIPDSIYVKDSEGRKIIANPADLKILNIDTESQLIGKTDIEIIPGPIGVRGYNDDMEVITTGKPIINKDEKFLMPDGSQLWLLTSKIPFSIDNNEITGLVGIGRDITELKKSNESIIKLSKAIEQSPLSIIITDTNGNIEYTNPKFTEITGYSSIEAKGKNPRIIKSGETPIDTYQMLWNSIKNGKEWRGELHNRKKNGELYWESVSISPIINENGEIINYIAIKEDITIQKDLLNELIVSKEKAEESDRLKSAFLANMSHEIRTPLNGILGFTELLIDPDFEEGQKSEMARLILENGDQLLSIINDVLDISKIESGLIDLNNSVFSVKQLLIDVKRTFEKNALANKIDLKIAENIPVNEIKIKSDNTKIKQVLNNLLSNALKYTDKGFVEIGYKDLETEIVFHVMDSGVGIPKEYQEKIFQRFLHLEPNRSKLAGGNGLGLSISKSFVEMMGGRIWVESEVGKGSCFYFSIPKNN